MIDRDVTRQQKGRLAPVSRKPAQPVLATSADRFQRATAASRPPRSPIDILALQQTAGNQAVQRLVKQSPGKSVDAIRRTGVAGAPRMVQRDGEPKTGGPEPGLDTGQGRITDWAVAVNAIGSQWTGISGIGSKQKEAVQNWYDLASKDDPPPAWKGLLINAVSIAAGSVTAGIGAVIINKVVNNETGNIVRFAVNTAVNAGKDTAKAVAGVAVDAAVNLHRHDGMMAYKKSMQDTISQTVDTEAGKLAVSMNGLAAKDPAARWNGMQELYDACEFAKLPAYRLQMMDAVEAWLNMQAMAEAGSVWQIGGQDIRSHTGLNSAERYLLDKAVREGTKSKLPEDVADKLKKLYGERWWEAISAHADQHAIADENDVSQVGTLGFYMYPGADPTQPMTVGRVEMESSKGNTQQIRSLLLASGKTIAEFKMPKSVKTDDLQAGSGHDNKYGWFEVAWPHDNSTWSLFTRGAGTFTHDDSDDNAGRLWLARYGKRSKDVKDDEITPNVAKGIARLEQELLHKTFSELNVSKIQT
jgi:hypothetical protein